MLQRSATDVPAARLVAIRAADRTLDMQARRAGVRRARARLTPPAQMATDAEADEISRGINVVLTDSVLLGRICAHLGLR